MKDHNFFPFITKPGRYVGREYNSTIPRSDEPQLRCALVFPDLYEIGMSHQGLQILYHILNAEKRISAERCYCPDKDAEAMLRARQLPLVSLESGRPLNQFDVIGITLPHELCYTNILTVLDRAEIPFLATERLESHPIIIGGGTCALNPEPVADFFDAILLGDGEEAIVELFELLLAARKNGLPRGRHIEALAEIDGVYLPNRYEPVYNDNGYITEIKHEATVPATIRRRVLADLDKLDHLYHPIVPNSRIVHDRLGVEVARGCTRGCRFCQAGITYRPVRERSVSQILEVAEKGLGNSGFEEMALLSLSTGDYSCLPELLPKLMDRCSQDLVSVSLPSMRVGTLTQELMDEIKRVRKTGFTLAPEAGSERLRNVINKGISEKDLLESAGSAFNLGWNLIKLYFMIGLPTETNGDIDAIIDLALKTAAAGNVSGHGRRKVNISVGTFVPKPHTPFQWEAQLSIQQSRERIYRLKDKMPRKGFNMKWHDPKQSYLEGVFSRGDRRLARLIVKAWQQGARLDSWSDHFDLDRWLGCAGDCGINLDFYLRKRATGEILPWSHLSSGVEERFLLDELEKAGNQEYTPDCRYHGCQQCGLCDFETIAPVVHKKKQDESPTSAASDNTVKEKKKDPEGAYRYRVSYSRSGAICYLGHLEFLQIIFRALRRAKIRTSFSRGYNPSPKVSFSPALPVGTESSCEWFIMELPEELDNCLKSAAALTTVMPDGISITDISPFQGKPPQELKICYTIVLEDAVSCEEEKQISSFLAARTFHVTRQRKGKTRQLDIRAMIETIQIISATELSMTVFSRSGMPGIKPLKALEHIMKRPEETLLSSRVHKTSWVEID
ncbi:MAG: TIGR03960 family B12-binding radical SAM protein [Desulfocapsaceae bacterium]|jgi:radical SAM family uncharacterized protein/radical SAM-linked protein|nr:TIGR03960 family B12-binding radical SAM protein [Desulfocapsaceae bacterium]